MSLSERRGLLLTLGAALATAGCGFEPLYATRTGAGPGQVRVEPPPGRRGHFYGRALRERLGEGGPEATYVLSSALSFTRREIAISTAEDVTRYDVLGEAAFALSRRGAPAPVLEGRVEAVSAYNTLAQPYAVAVAERDAERRVSEELARKVSLEVSAALAAGARSGA